MLVLTRKTGEEIQIGPGIRITVLLTSKNRIKLGISAPAEVPVIRGELHPNTVSSQRTVLVGA
jgi:carbon storage regulator CsrA